jgi:hypothetical protein
MRADSGRALPRPRLIVSRIAAPRPASVLPFRLERQHSVLSLGQVDESWARRATNSSCKFWGETFLRASGLDRVDYVILVPSVERCVARVGTRRANGFSDEGATRAMHRQFAEADMERRHLLLDPPDQPERHNARRNRR